MTFVTRIAGAAALGAAMAIGSSLSAPPARAGYVVTLEQQGSNVVATGSGSIDLTGLTFEGNNGGGTAVSINPNLGIIVTGPVGTAADLYSGLNKLMSFGSGSVTPADSGSGDIAGDAFGFLFVPTGYVSDDPLSSSASWDNWTFKSLRDARLLQIDLGNRAEPELHTRHRGRAGTRASCAVNTRGRPCRAGVGRPLAETAPDLIAIHTGAATALFPGSARRLGSFGLAHSGTGANK